MGVIKTDLNKIKQASTPIEAFLSSIPQEETKQESAEVTTKQKPKQATSNQEKRTERISLVVTPTMYKKIENASWENRQTINSYLNDILKAILGE